ncbi:hypothetical protein [Ornithinibacillus halotolerans]|uniref:Uncharacterized protein n=1 Tax=Ornithinibacillus halotolerans TaxID=1274357 RepID=A0A916SE01_9BACI|nr:hypothetical protein [Ornithinibacillus halotolerans]GGA92926.1 hypothetical protein GCM10008025_39170 [Ornithinibacillus halotolerans]
MKKFLVAFVLLIGLSITSPTTQIASDYEVGPDPFRDNIENPENA